MIQENVAGDSKKSSFRQCSMSKLNKLTSLNLRHSQILRIRESFFLTSIITLNAVVVRDFVQLIIVFSLNKFNFRFIIVLGFFG